MTKIHDWIQPWKGDKRWTALAARANALKKARKDQAEIVTTLEAEFGPPGVARRGLYDAPQPLAIFGEVGEDIQPAAVAQMELALRLPIAVRGALMPDAHPGYALPIGGVFAAHNAVSPSMVGVDIGCRMHLSLFAEDADDVMARRGPLFRTLQTVAAFGMGARRAWPADHPILEDARWGLTPQTRHLRTKAAAHLGTSGSGNHFAELVIGERIAPDSGLPERFCGLLTHSGSRGVGYALANHYQRLAAMETAAHSQAPKMYEWLDLDKDSGREYWEAMTLAGDFARACHEVLHAEFARRTGLSVAQTVQNHHNFAWREGDLIVHRKGATPAGLGERGVIPGSMASASYLVEGTGADASLASASHGAGRVGSRASARDRISLREVRRLLAEQDILVEGLSADEAPDAYKDIERVIRQQVGAGLIRPLARMRPIAVIMAGEQESRE